MSRKFSTAEDRFKPIWWDDLNVPPAEIELTVDPRAARRSPPIACDGMQTVTVAHDASITYSEAEGFRDLAAEERQRAADEERRQGDHTAWIPGEQ